MSEESCLYPALSGGRLDLNPLTATGLHRFVERQKAGGGWLIVVHGQEPVIGLMMHGEPMLAIEQYHRPMPPAPGGDEDRQLGEATEDKGRPQRQSQEGER